MDLNFLSIHKRYHVTTQHLTADILSRPILCLNVMSSQIYVTHCVIAV